MVGPLRTHLKGTRVHFIERGKSVVEKTQLWSEINYYLNPRDVRMV